MPNNQSILTTLVRLTVLQYLIFLIECATVHYNIPLDPPHKHNLRKIHLSPEKCNKNEKTINICRVLSKSTKFRNGVDRYMIPPRSRTIKRLDYFDFPKEYSEYHDYPTFVGERQPKIYFSGLPLLEKHQFKFRNVIWPQVLHLRDKLAELPLVAAGAPLMCTLGIALLLKYQMKAHRTRLVKKHEGNMLWDSEEDEQAMGSEEERADDKKEASERLALTKEIIGLTAESLNLAANKLDLFNVLARTLTDIGSGPGPGGPNTDNGLLLLHKLSGNKIKGNGNKIKKEDIAKLVGNFVKTVAEQSIANATLHMR